MRKRIAIIESQKCHPQECGNYLCAKLCPVNRAGADCIYPGDDPAKKARIEDRKSTRLNSSHSSISYAVFCLKKKQYLQRIELHHYRHSQLFSLDLYETH